MSNPKEYHDQIMAILKDVMIDNQISVYFENPAEAKMQRTKIVQVQKQLRLVKQDISLTMRDTRAQYQTAKTDVGKGFGAGVLQGIFGKKGAGGIFENTRDSIKRKQLDALTPYEAQEKLIDAALVQLDNLKMQIDNWLLKDK
jgi:hypothetical protein